MTKKLLVCSKDFPLTLSPNGGEGTKRGTC